MTSGTPGPQPTEDLLAGTPYRPLRILGEGGMGFVVEAEHRRLGKRFAVKLLHSNLTDDPMFADRMRVEAEILANLESSHVVGVTDSGFTQKGDAYIAMDLLRGRSMADEIKARREIAVLEAVEWARQALRGIAAAHALGIVHRDLKPANLFIAEVAQSTDKIVKVLDFGVAKIVAPEASPVGPPQAATKEGVAVGSPKTMSPEQCKAEKVDARSDLYSMGIVLYTMLAGRGPFDDRKTLLDLARAHVFDPPERPSQKAQQVIPSALDALVLKALEKKPDDRFQSAADFERALGTLSDELKSAGQASTEPKRQASTVLMQPAAAAAAMQGARVDRASPAPLARGGTMKIDGPHALQGPIVEVAPLPAPPPPPGFGAPMRVGDAIAEPVVRPVPPVQRQLRAVGADDGAGLSTTWVVLGVVLALLVFGGAAAWLLHSRGVF